MLFWEIFLPVLGLLCFFRLKEQFFTKKSESLLKNSLQIQPNSNWSKDTTAFQFWVSFYKEIFVGGGSSLMKIFDLALQS
jgi:hypothetical protein